MNLLLLDSSQISAHPIVLVGRPARHVVEILKKKAGDELKVGIARRGFSRARILRLVSSEQLELELGPIEAPTLPRIELIVALPRPKGLSRLLQTVASFGIRRIDLIDGYRVDKSYFSSTRLTPARIREDLWLGCEQGAQCWLPECHVQRGFGEYIQKELPVRLHEAVGSNLLLHPEAAGGLTPSDVNTRSPLRLAVGPEGGWTSGELACFEALGFRRIRLGPAILKTETALAAVLGQIALLDS